MSLHVLDASAVLAYLWKENGWETVEAILLADQAIISTVNVSEVASKALERGFTETEARHLIENLGMQEVDFDQQQSWRAASLRNATKSLGLSLAGRMWWTLVG